MYADVYQPRRDLPAKIKRRLVRRQVTNVVPLKLERPIVTFTFDDVPESVLTNALPMLEARGHTATLYVATGLMGRTNHLGRMMDADQIRDAHARGHEIAAHTHSHRDLAQLSTEEQALDLAESTYAFADLGIPQPLHFAWPYGECSRDGKRMAATRYHTLRGIAPKVHMGRVDLNQLGSIPMFTGRLDRMKRALDALDRGPGWLTLFTHDVQDEPSPWGITPQELSEVLNWIDALDANVLPIGTATSRILREEAA